MLGISRAFDIFLGILTGLAIGTFIMSLKNHKDIERMKNYVHDEIDNLYAKLCPDFVEPVKESKPLPCYATCRKGIMDCVKCQIERMSDEDVKDIISRGR